MVLDLQQQQTRRQKELLFAQTNVQINLLGYFPMVFASSADSDGLLLVLPVDFEPRVV